MNAVRQTGRTLFGDNCAVCHGTKATGGKGFPNLTADSWLYGGSPEAIAETIRVGINSAHPESRVAQMPAFGRDKILSRKEIENVTAYLQSFSNPAVQRKAIAEQIEAGRKVFAASCAACHSDNAKGKTETGAPDLTDPFWIYGGDLQSIYTTIWDGRQGRMPTWETRLSSLERKILALYIVDLRAKQ
jgi:cytochrome c oxidase cbb3-type subunit 3